MGTRERYEHGVFSYVELATGDAAGAKEFYAALFGWTFEDVPVGEGMVYSPAHLDGKRVAALYETDKPATWLSYVTVDDLRVTAANVEAAGGTVVQQPYDVMDQGRMAIVADPQTAVFALWEAKRNIGAELVNVPGALAWNDLQTSDVAAAAEFYEELLGWETAEAEGAPGDRRGIRVGERLNGGMAKLADAAAEHGASPHWLAYFASADAAATCETARQAGATVAVEPMEVPSGHLAVLIDPQGVAFGVVDGEMDD